MTRIEGIQKTHFPRAFRLLGDGSGGHMNEVDCSRPIHAVDALGSSIRLWTLHSDSGRMKHHRHN